MKTLTQSITHTLLHMDIPQGFDISTMTQDCQDFVLEHLIEECAPLLARDRELFEELDRMIEDDRGLDQFDQFFAQHVHGYDKKREHSIDMLKQYVSIGQGDEQEREDALFSVS